MGVFRTARRGEAFAEPKGLCKVAGHLSLGNSANHVAVE